MKQARHQRCQHDPEVTIVICFRDYLKVNLDHLLQILFSLAINSQMISSPPLLLSNLLLTKLTVINAAIVCNSSKERKTVFSRKHGHQNLLSQSFLAARFTFPWECGIWISHCYRSASHTQFALPGLGESGYFQFHTIPSS